MRVFDTMDAYARECGACVAVLGMFDGVHLGHAALIGEAVRQARLRGVRAVAVTFRANPLEVLRPEAVPGDIQTLPEKLSAIERLGIDAAVCETFSAEYARRSGRAFAQELRAKLQARAVVAGYNYTFGDGAACGPQELERLGHELGFEVTIASPVRVNGEAVSSTLIRERLRVGDIASASAMLGRPYELCGAVMHGKRLGRALGFPTANINLESGRALPRAGVYICALRFDGKWMAGVLNLGSQPTAPSGLLTCEVNALSEIGDVYGRFMQVRFIRFSRPEMKFSGLNELRGQIERDKAAARSFFEREPDLLTRMNALP